LGDFSVNYERLGAFIATQMRMSHVYQPVMIRTLLQSSGRASIEAIAKALLGEDRSQGARPPLVGYAMLAMRRPRAEVHP
jgi:hypothetical protein